MFHINEDISCVAATISSAGYLHRTKSRRYIFNYCNACGPSACVYIALQPRHAPELVPRSLARAHKTKRNKSLTGPIKRCEMVFVECVATGVMVSISTQVLNGAARRVMKKCPECGKRSCLIKMIENYDG